jgi:hypothetical protein
MLEDGTGDVVVRAAVLRERFVTFLRAVFLVVFSGDNIRAVCYINDE